MPRSHPAVGGRWAEQRALRMLLQRGWRLLARNWRCRWGELDLVLAKPGRLLLVEVKGRAAPGRDGAGCASLRHGKQQRLRRTALCWLAEHPQCQNDSIELVAALVPLPPWRQPVRWLSLTDWGRAGRYR